MCAVYLVMQGNSILGYFTLSNTAVYRQSLSNTQAKKFPFNQIPAILIGQLARDDKLSSSGFGRVILAHAFKEALKQDTWTLLCADPYSEDSERWFLKQGFKQVAKKFPELPSTRPVEYLQLYYRRVDIEAALASAGQ